MFHNCTRVTAEIFQQARGQYPPGRFLQQVTSRNTKSLHPYNVGGWWVEIDDTKALAKISQALREGAPAFRALHGKKGKKREQCTTSHRTSTRRMQKRKDTEGVPSREKRKEPCALESGVSVASHVESLPSSFPMNTHNGRELDVLFPTANTMFASEKRNGLVLDSYPLVRMGDYTASMNDVARAIPSPPTAKKTRVPATTTDVRPDAQPSGGCATPKFLPALNTPLVSPGISPPAEADTAWDAIAFLPNLSPTAGNHGEYHKKPSLERIHSPSVSDSDVRSIGTFNNPFENDNHKQDLIHQPGLECSNPIKDLEIFPPLSPSSQHGLSIGRIGSVQERNTPIHKSSRSSLGSISNLSDSKRKSIG